MPVVTLEEHDEEMPTVFEATITASPYVFAQLDDLDLDLLPTQEPASEDRVAVEALVRPAQLVPLVAAGATVELRRLVPPRFPQDRIMSSEGARARLRGLDRLRGQAGG